jgi:hypothetical protein
MIYMFYMVKTDVRRLVLTSNAKKTSCTILTMMRKDTIICIKKRFRQEILRMTTATAALTSRAESDFNDVIIPRNDLASFCGALKDVDCSELEATQAAFSEIDAEMWK